MIDIINRHDFGGANMAEATLYHATSHANAGKILREGFRIPQVSWGEIVTHHTTKSPGSLGYGIYGFLNDLQLAGEFWSSATSFSQKHDTIEIQIQYDDEKCLNFVDNVRDMIFFREFLRNAHTQAQLRNLHHLFHNTFKQHAFDGAILEYYISYLRHTKDFETVDIVCCATTTDVYNNFKIFIPNGIEYNLRNQSVIEDFNVKENTNG